MNKTAIFLLPVFAFCTSALANVYKCKGPDGKTVYTDEACGRNATRLSNLDTNTLPAIQLAKQPQLPPAVLGSGPGLPDRQIPATPRPFMANATECERARRNADTTASSITADPKRVELAQMDVNITCYGSARAGEIEQARAGATRVIIHNTRPVLHAPRSTTHCLGTHCDDERGERHPRIRP